MRAAILSSFLLFDHPWFPLTPKRTFLHPSKLPKTSKSLGVIAVSNGLRPKF